jgi:toluene monooxygenase electron transfer component
VIIKTGVSQYRVSIADTGLFFETSADDTILGSMLRAGIGAPYECNAGGCGSCKFTLVEGEVKEDLVDCAGLKGADRRKNKRLACVSRAAGDCTINIRLDDTYKPAIFPHKMEAIFVSRKPLTHDLWEFLFKAEGPAQFFPGQYAKLHISGVSGPRSYSMANTANDLGEWQFQIKRMPDGEATTMLFDKDIEEITVVIDAPYSIAHLDAKSARSIIGIAGGSGLAPMVSILRGVAELKGGAEQAVLYYGARSVADVVNPRFFKRIPGFDPDKQYIPVVSEADGPSPWTGPTGFLHEHLARALPENCREIDFYIAGPPPMVEAVRRHLVLERQIPMEHLRYDRFF